MPLVYLWQNNGFLSIQTKTGRITLVKLTPDDTVDDESDVSITCSSSKTRYTNEHTVIINIWGHLARIIKKRKQSHDLA